MRDAAFGVEPFELVDYHGEVAAGFEPSDLEAAVAQAVDQGRAAETLHWGRNYLYGMELETLSGGVAVAVKQFRNQGLRARLERRWKGSKALRSWRVACALRRAGIPTPEPLLWIESRRPDGPSFFVTRRLRGFVEARYYFRALEANRELQEFPEIDPESLVAELGRAIRRLHAAGIWHRDLSVGNLLIQPAAGEGPRYTVFFIDLNRARLNRWLTIGRRTRDLSRLRVFRRSHQDLLLRSYWGEASAAMAWKGGLYRFFFQGFLLRIRAKTALRAPLRSLRDRLAPRHAYTHIPAPPDDAPTRELAVWDGLSDQPHQHATRLQRLAIRVSDAPLHARELHAGIMALPRAWRRYRQLREHLYAEPHGWQGMGVAVRPWPENPAAVLRSLEKLGTRRVLLRLHPWQRDHDLEEELAGELARRGFELAFTLPQSRELVKDRARWQEAVVELQARFGHLGRHFQIGQAINRSKWGVWNHSEYLELAAAAAEILRQDPAVELLGPAVIDYELHRTAAILNIPRPGVFFDILASLLYVDRRGAPENRQLGFDTVDKVIQLKALAETSPACGGRSWITEFNWPLWEGPHSPAGRRVAVDEETQADYLVRYYLLALGTGMVERVYWWQLLARGYGLCHDDGAGDVRLRPSFYAYANLCRLLEGSVCLGPIEAQAPCHLQHFRRPDGEEIVVAWSADGSRSTAELPRPSRQAMGRGGELLNVPANRNIEIDGSPRYFWIGPG